MRFIIKSFLLALTGLLILSCSENKPGTGKQSGNDFSSIPDKKMCEILTKEMMTSITGIAFNEETSILHQTDKAKGKYVSQCGYYSDGGNMGVLVRRFGNSGFPKTKEALLGEDKTGDPELDEIQEKALQSCKTVNGLGDAAIFYDLGGIYNLIVIFKDYYQIHVSSYGKGFGFDDKTMEVSRKVAEEVMKILS